MPEQDLEMDFPGLRTVKYQITSEVTEDYNCAAWAGEDNTKKWDPAMTQGRYWPDGVKRSLRLESFIDLFKMEGGYTPCEHGDLEPGFQKIALYQNSHLEVTHASRQLESGAWTSKIGVAEDIMHANVQCLEGKLYGQVVQYLKRPVRA